MKKPDIQCPYGCPMKIARGKHAQKDLIHHFWGGHKMDAIQAHKAAEHFLTTGKTLPLVQAA